MCHLKKDTIRSPSFLQINQPVLLFEEPASIHSTSSQSSFMLIGVKASDLVVEAATENADLKLNIFKELDAACPPEAILASNTSSISITKIAAATGRPGWRKSPELTRIAGWLNWTSRMRNDSSLKRPVRVDRPDHHAESGVNTKSGGHFRVRVKPVECHARRGITQG